MAVDSGARPSNTLTGDLGSRPLIMLLAGSSERGTSGTFTFRNENARAVLTLRAGAIAVVRTKGSVHYLGGILHERGAIDLTTLNATLQAVATDNRLHGEVLLERGAISRATLDDALAEQTMRKVHDLFALPDETKWFFREDVDELAGARDEPRPTVSTWAAIWRGLRDQPTTGHMDRTLRKIDGAIHLKDLPFVARFDLNKEEFGVCEQLHAKPTTLARLVSTSPLGPDRARRLVYLLAVARSIVRIEAAPLRPTDLGVAGIRARARSVESEDPYTALGLRGGSSREAARAAYVRLARMWHPDKLPPELDEVRPECERIFARLGDAHRMLTDASVPRLEDLAGGDARAANDSLAPSMFPASHSLRDADAALARGDLKTAEGIARQLSSNGVDGPGARAILAWCSVGGGSSADPRLLELALMTLDRVIKGDPDCVRALMFRGRLLERVGRIDESARDLRKATRLSSAEKKLLREGT